MSGKRWIVVGVIVLAAAVLSVAVIWDRTVEGPEAANVEPGATGTVSFLMEQQWLIQMKLAVAEEVSVAPQITSTGRVVPAPGNQAIVAPPVGGILRADTLPRIGQNVSRGQLLATLVQIPTAAESSQIRVENARLDAEKRRLQQAIIENEVRANLAKTEFDRATRLYERKAYSLRQLQTAETEYKAAEATLVAVREQLDAIAVEAASTTTFEIRAPISGTIAEIQKSNGEHVQPGETILQIVNLGTVWVEAPIFERDLSRLQTALKAVFTTAAFPDAEFQGDLINIGAVIDERSRAATAVFQVPNPERRLRIGMQANVRLDTQETTKVVMVPKEAVLEHEGKKIVYVLLSGEEFQRREVQVGDEYGDKIAVISGLTGGQRVVTQGAYQLKLQELRPAGPVEHTHEV